MIGVCVWECVWERDTVCESMCCEYVLVCVCVVCVCECVCVSVCVFLWITLDEGQLQWNDPVIL